MGTLVFLGVGLLTLGALASGGRRSEPTPAPQPPHGGGNGGGGSGGDPTIGEDGYPQIVFYEDGAWEEPTQDWFGYASNEMLSILHPWDASAPAPDYGEFDYAYILAWEFLRDEVPEGMPFPLEPYAPNGEMWQTSYPGENYFEGSDYTLGLIEHLAAYIDAALPHYQETGEFILLPEGMF